MEFVLIHPPPTNCWSFWSLTKEGIYYAWQLLHSETRQKRIFENGSEPGVAWEGDYLGVVGVGRGQLDNPRGFHESTWILTLNPRGFQQQKSNPPWI